MCVAGVVVGKGEVVSGCDRLDVVRAERGLIALERRLEDRDGVGKAARGVVGLAEVVAVVERLGVVRPEPGLQHLVRGKVQRNRLVNPADGGIHEGEVASSGEDVEVVGTQSRFENGECLLDCIQGLRVFSQAGVGLTQGREHLAPGCRPTAKLAIEHGHGVVE